VEQDAVSREQAIALLPESWRSELIGARWAPVDSQSGAAVWRVRHPTLRERFLKLGTGSCAQAIRREIERTAWLHSQSVNVPPVLQAVTAPDFAAVLFAALPGEPLDSCRLPPGAIIPVLARAFSRLHSLAAADCSFDEGMQTRLERAKEAIAAGAVDRAQFDDRNADKSPEDLFAQLTTKVPVPEPPVVVHGDATFSNLLFDPAQQIGFVDCGNCGRADRYVDLSLLAAEIGERYGTEWIEVFCRSYGLPGWDRARQDFYLDLYEFF